MHDNLSNDSSPAPSQPILIPFASQGSVEIPPFSLADLSSSFHSSSSSSTGTATFPGSPTSIASSPSPFSPSSPLDPASADSCCSTCCPSAPLQKQFPTIISPESFQPLIIVGAGPHALALAARLSEHRPAALYTDLEHARLSWLDREHRNRRATVKGHWSARKLVEPKEADVVDKRMFKVLDSTSDKFCGRWDAFFKGLHIEHLRSPMLFHPAPADADALVAFAQQEGRENELAPITGVVGREQSKYQRKKHPSRVGRAVAINERDAQDYHRPSTPLYKDFIERDLIDRYDLSSLVTRATVTSVSYGSLHVQGQETLPGFTVTSTLPDGSTEVLGARAVVFAVGPSSRPNVPAVILDALAEAGQPATGDENLPWSEQMIKGQAWCHSAAFALEGFKLFNKGVREKIARGERTTIVVVGGGLTSAQICDLAVQRGATRVVLLARGHIKVKHFDFDLEWVAKYANLAQMAFWQEEDPSARWDIIQTARNGGSVNPHFHSVLKKHAKSGPLDLRTFTQLKKASYDPERRKWSLEVETMLPLGKVAGDKDRATPREPETEMIEDVDFVICSTGSKLDFAQLPCVEPLLKSHPINLVHGLPVLTKDLQWNEDLPAFVMGAYAMLELGPGALNVHGTRYGSERVAHRLGELGFLREEVVDEGYGEEAEPHRQVGKGRTRREQKESRSGGRDNYYAMLDEAEA